MQKKVSKTFCKFISVSLAVCAIFLPTSFSYAQSIWPSAHQSGNNTANNINLEEFGVPQDSKFTSRLNGSEEVEISPLLDVSAGVPENITYHFRSTKGIEFPPAPEKLDINALLDQKTELDPDEAAAFQAQAQDMLDRNSAIPKIKECTFDKTDTTPTHATIKRELANDVVFDMLFMNDKDIPLDPEVAIGKGTIVIPYSAQKVSIAGLAMSTGSVPCLPFRIRSTPEYYFQDQGLNALKNYDGNYKGAGVLTETMKKILFRSKDYEK